mmetsp:Transcript_20965/g.67929  ORF Transcript_20965/g.67929 Transcript_20965/m.67929 type:complete len:218 (+) Transcript_20965:350-1003(+)
MSKPMGSAGAMSKSTAVPAARLVGLPPARSSVAAMASKAAPMMPASATGGSGGPSTPAALAHSGGIERGERWVRKRCSAWKGVEFGGTMSGSMSSTIPLVPTLAARRAADEAGGLPAETRAGGHLNSIAPVGGGGEGPLIPRSSSVCTLSALSWRKAVGSAVSIASEPPAPMPARLRPSPNPRTIDGSLPRAGAWGWPPSAARGLLCSPARSGLPEE